jgi:hypothetical protein
MLDREIAAQREAATLAALYLEILGTRDHDSRGLSSSYLLQRLPY